MAGSEFETRHKTCDGSQDGGRAEGRGQSGPGGAPHHWKTSPVEGFGRPTSPLVGEKVKAERSTMLFGSKNTLTITLCGVRNWAKAAESRTSRNGRVVNHALQNRLASEMRALLNVLAMTCLVYYTAVGERKKGVWSGKWT